MRMGDAVGQVGCSHDVGAASDVRSPLGRRGEREGVGAGQETGPAPCSPVRSLGRYALVASGSDGGALVAASDAALHVTWHDAARDDVVRARNSLDALGTPLIGVVVLHRGDAAPTDRDGNPTRESAKEGASG